LLLSVGLAIEFDVTGIAIAVVVASLLRFLLTLSFIVIKTQVTSMQLIKAFMPSILSSTLIIITYSIISLVPILSGLVGIIISVLLFLLLSIALPLDILISNHVVMFVNKFKAKYFLRNMRQPS
jgi:hypothetical protein